MTKWIMIIDDTDEKENKLELRRNDDGSFYARFMTYTGNYVDFSIKPIRGPAMIVMPDGDSAYITPGHIDAMLEYERVQHIKEIYDRMNRNLDGINEVDLPKHVPLITPEEVKRQFGLESDNNGGNT